VRHVSVWLFACVFCAWLAPAENVSEFSVGPFGGGDLECGQLASYLLVDGYWPELVWPNTPGPRAGDLRRFVGLGWGEEAWTFGLVRAGPPVPALDLAGEWRFRFDKTAEAFRKDGFLEGVRAGWFARDFDDSSWRTIAVPGEWISQTGSPNGYAWHRRRFVLREVRPMLLYVGGIDDASTIYLNGREVGRTRGWKTPHQFDVTEHLVRGENVIAIAVEDWGGGAGITSPIKLIEKVAGVPVVQGAEQEISWVTKTTTLRLEGGRFFRYRASRLTPFFAVETDLDKLQLFEGLARKSEGQPSWIAFPARGGPRCARLAAAGVQGSELAECWFLVWFNGSQNWGFDAPVLVVLQRRPRELRLDRDALVVDFGGRECGLVAVAPLCGVRRLALAETAAWSRGLPAEVLGLARRLASSVRALPVGCAEEFEPSAGGWVRVVNRFAYLRTEDDWSTAPLEIAPVPPVLALAAELGYPARIEGAVEDPRIATFHGPWRFVPGADVLRYELPGPGPYLDSAWDAPPAGSGADQAPWAREARATLNETARRELPGDIAGLKPPIAQTWALGSHAQRVTSAIISMPFLDPEPAALAREYIERTLSEVLLNPAYYTVYEDGPTGRKVTVDLLRVRPEAGARECDIPWSHGHLFHCLDTWARRSADLARIRRMWPTLKEAFKVFEFTQDWPILSHYAHTHGYGIGGEDKLISFAGMTAFASLARALGDDRAAARALYLAAKMMASHFASLQAPSWAYRQRGGLPWVTEYFWLSDSPHDSTMLGEGWHEVYGLQLCTYTEPPRDWFLATVINPEYPAVMAFLSDKMPQIVRRLEYEILPTHTPLWDRYGLHGQGAHIVARAWLFGESPARCWQYAKEGLDAGGNFGSFENLPRVIAALLGPRPRGVKRVAPPAEIASRDLDEFRFNFQLLDTRAPRVRTVAANRREYGLSDVELELETPRGTIRRRVGELGPAAELPVELELAWGAEPERFLERSKAAFRYRSLLDGARCVHSFALVAPPRRVVLADFAKGPDGFAVADCDTVHYRGIAASRVDASALGAGETSPGKGLLEVSYELAGHGGGDGVTVRREFPEQDWRFWREVRAHVFIPELDGEYHGLVSVNTRKAHWQPSQGARLTKGWNVLARPLDTVMGPDRVGKLWVRVVPMGAPRKGRFYIGLVELVR